MFGPKRAEIVGGWRKLHSEELRNSYPLLNIRMKKSRMRCVEHVASMGGTVLLGKPEGQRPVERQYG
jgi:hypothetical protein